MHSSNENPLAEMNSLSFSDNFFSNGFSKKKLLYPSADQVIIQWMASSSYNNLCSRFLIKAIQCKSFSLNFVTPEDALFILDSEHV